MHAGAIFPKPSPQVGCDSAASASVAADRSGRTVSSGSNTPACGGVRDWTEQVTRQSKLGAPISLRKYNAFRVRDTNKSIANAWLVRMQRPPTVVFLLLEAPLFPTQALACWPENLALIHSPVGARMRVVPVPPRLPR